MTEATSGDVTIRVNQAIEFLVNRKQYKGKIEKFQLVDPLQWKSIWFRVIDVVSSEAFWISFNNWLDDYRNKKLAKVPESFMTTTSAENLDANNFI